MSLGFALPVLFGFFVFHLLRHRTSLALGWRQAWLGAVVITGVYLVALTETLSAFHALTSIGVALFWLAGIMAAIALRMRWKPSGTAPSSLIETFLREEPLAEILHVLTAFLVAVTGFLAVLAVPNSWDAMTYHLPRVAHWYQNHSIAIFATSCMYQNQHCPFAEWSILNLFLLQGRDQLANMVEWTGYLGSIMAGSLLAEACGGSRVAGGLAAFFIATLPMAILQAGSVQTDEILGFWLLCTAYGCVKIATEPRWSAVLFFAASLGLALLTKALAYLFAPAFCVWVFFSLLRRGLGMALPRLLIIALIGLVLNAGYYTRNWTTTGTLLGCDADSGPGYRYMNEVHTPGAIFSNILRNLSLQAPQFPIANKTATALVINIHAWLGLDPSDPRVTNFAVSYSISQGLLDDEVANPLHLLTITIGYLILLFAGKRIGLSTHLLALSVLVGGFLFCLVLKWQPFNSRLHLPLFLLALPLAAVALENLRARMVTMCFISLMLIGALPLVFDNYSHPLFGTPNIFHEAPDYERFLIRRENLPEYREVLEILRKNHVQTIGVIGPADNSGWEYPLFAPDDTQPSFPWRVEQVQVTNFYAGLETQDQLDVVVSLIPSLEETITVHGTAYHCVHHGGVLSVYLK